MRQTKVGLAIVCMLCAYIFAAQFQMSVEELENKIKGGWLGKTAGVCTGGPTEFQAEGVMYTGSLNLNPDMSGGFWQDDIYVQITFIAEMDAKLNQPNGIWATTMRDYANAFKNTSYELWWANAAGRENLLEGDPPCNQPPYSGMWATGNRRCNNVAEAIDFQIESDWIGLMCPGMPQTAQRLCDSVGHIMNYGDGLYGGYFVSAMIALAFTHNDIHTIVKKALSTIPPESDYYKCVNDVVTFHDQNPTKDYKACWEYVTHTKNWVRYKSSPCIGQNSEGGKTQYFNIMANLNGAYIAIGLLYGDGDIKKAIEYATRCGQDSDCNPANAGAVMGTMLGFNALPAEWKNSINQYPTRTYSGSNYTYSQLITSSINRAKKCIQQTGGTLNGTVYTINGEEPCQPKIFEKYGYEPVPNPHYNASCAMTHVVQPVSKSVRKATIAHGREINSYDLVGRRIGQSDPRSLTASAGVCVLSDGSILALRLSQ